MYAVEKDKCRSPVVKMLLSGHHNLESGLFLEVKMSSNTILQVTMPWTLYNILSNWGIFETKADV